MTTRDPEAIVKKAYPDAYLCHAQISTELYTCMSYWIESHGRPLTRNTYDFYGKAWDEAANVLELKNPSETKAMDEPHLTEGNDREQAIRDAAFIFGVHERVVLWAVERPINCETRVDVRTKYAVSQRERVVALERALRNARQSIVDGKPLGAVNLIDAALNGESK